MSRLLLYRVRMTALGVLSLLCMPCGAWHASEETMAQETISRADTLLHHLPAKLNRSIRKMEQSRRIPPRQRVDLINGLLQQAHRKVDVFTSLQRTLEELLVHSDNLRVRTRSNVERLSVRMSSYRRVALEKIDELERELMRAENEVQRTVRQELEISLNAYRTKKKKDELPYDPIDSLVNALAPEEGDASSYRAPRYQEEVHAPASTSTIGTFSRLSTSGASIVRVVSDELSRDIRWILFRLLDGYHWVRDGIRCAVAQTCSIFRNLRAWYARKPVEHTIHIENENNHYGNGKQVKERHLVRAWAVYQMSALWVRTNNSIRRMGREACHIASTLTQDVKSAILAVGSLGVAACHGVKRVVNTAGGYALVVPRALYRGMCFVPRMAQKTGTVFVENVSCATRVVARRVRNDVTAVGSFVQRGASCVTAALNKLVCGVRKILRISIATVHRMVSSVVCRVRALFTFKRKAASSAPVTQKVVAQKPAGPSRLQLLRQKVTGGIHSVVGSFSRAGSSVGTTSVALSKRVISFVTGMVHAGANAVKRLCSGAITISRRIGIVCINATRRLCAVVINIARRFTAAVVTGVRRSGAAVVTTVKRVGNWSTAAARGATTTTANAAVGATKNIYSGCRFVVTQTAEKTMQGGRQVKRFATSFTGGVVRLSERALCAARCAVQKVFAGIRYLLSFFGSYASTAVTGVAQGATTVGKATIQQTHNICGATYRGVKAATTTVANGTAQVGRTALSGAQSLYGATCRGVRGVANTTVQAGAYTAHAGRAAVSGVVNIGKKTVQRGCTLCSSAYRRVTGATTTMAAGTASVAQTIGYGIRRVARRARTALRRVNTALIVAVTAVLRVIMRATRNIMTLSKRMFATVHTGATQLIQRSWHLARASVQAVTNTTGALVHRTATCFASLAKGCINVSRRAGSAVVGGAHGLGAAAQNVGRKAIAATTHGCCHIGTYSKQAFNSVQAGVSAGWAGVCRSVGTAAAIGAHSVTAGAQRFCAAVAMGTQKITAGAQEMGIAVKSGAQKAVAHTGYGMHTTYTKVTTTTSSAFASLRTAAFTALTMVSDWSRLLRERFVAFLHAVRIKVESMYAIVHERFIQWWRPKYVMPEAISADEVQQVAQQHNVGSQDVSIADPESIVPVSSPTPTQRMHNRLVHFCVNAWHTVKKAWQRVAAVVVRTVSTATTAVKSMCTSCCRTGTQAMHKGLSFAQKGAQKSVMCFGRAIDGTRHFVRDGAAAATDTAAHIVRGGVAAAKSGWHTVKNAVWKQKERLPWTDSTHRGAKVTSPTKMVTRPPAFSATPSRLT